MWRELVLRFHRFHVLVAAVCPALLFSFLLCGCCAPEYVDAFLLSLVMLADAMRSLDIIRVPVTLVSRDLGSFRIMCHWLAYMYVSLSLSRDFTICA